MKDLTEITSLVTVAKPTNIVTVFFPVDKRRSRFAWQWGLKRGLRCAKMGFEWQGRRLQQVREFFI